WNEARSLMKQLIERMLAVCAWFAPIDGAGIIGDFITIERDMFAVALHRQLLQVCRKSLQVLLVRQDRNGLCAEEVVIPNSQQPHEHREVALEGSGAEMLVHLVEAVQHGAEVIRPYGKHRREA